MKRNSIRYFRFQSQLKSDTIKNTFNKQERLCSRKQIEVLFSKGTSGTVYPLKLMHADTDLEQPFPAQAMFVAPKRSFKRAHDRNTLKRRMREAYRLNKAGLYTALTTENKKKLLAFIYIGKKEEEYSVIETAMLKLMAKHLQRM